MLPIWELWFRADQHLCIQHLDLRYFGDHFVGRSMASTWTTPPYEILNRSKKVGDFVSFQIGSRAFLVTERAMREIEQIADGAVEFLPFDTIKGKPVHAANVIRTEDFIDAEATEWQAGSGLPARIVFRTNLPSELPPIFKLVGGAGTYVSAAFGRMLVKTGLTGVALADPGENRFRQVVHREEINAFPGL